MALLPSHPLDRDDTCTTRPRLQPIVANVPLTEAERIALASDRRLQDGIHCEFLDAAQRDHLCYLAWRLETGRLTEII